MAFSDESKRAALTIARKSVEAAALAGRAPTKEELPVPGDREWLENRAVFVTLRRGGELRGCIGHIEPVEPLWRSIRDNAVSAATRDYRFSPVSAEEVPLLTIEISVLTPPKTVASWMEFAVGEEGVIMELGGSGAVFLPQVAVEQGWDAETTLAHLSLKAGLSPMAFRNPEARFRTFRAEVFSEEAQV